MSLALDPTVDGELEALLGRLSWAEKLAQLQIAYRPRFEDAAALVRSGIGAVFWAGDAERTNELQRIAREESPHGIPLLVGLDVIHGQYTIFPTPLMEAASLDPEIARVDARESAREAASGGVNWTFSPMIDVSLDPRWGRVVEGFGEDPLLTAVFGAAKVAGYQHDLGPDSLLACAKHFVAYGAAEGGRDYNTADVSEHRLRSLYLPPFRTAIEAGAASVMASFNTVDGRPMHAHGRLLTDVLKREWGFAGIVVGDADGVVQLVPHGVAETEADAVAMALTAGLDVEMGGHVVVDGEPTIAPDAVATERVDDAVRRLLRLKFARGLFASATVDPAAERREPTSATRAAARAAAARCPVLLTHDGTLPLRPDVTSVLVVGPYAESTDHLGAWTQSFAAPARSIVGALRDALPGARVDALAGAGFFDVDPARQAEAARRALEYDVVFAAVGEPSALSGEAASRAGLELTGDQAALIHAIADTGVPFAVLLVAERPLAIADWIDRAPTVLMTGHLGTEAAEAIADLVTGAVSPAGRLPMSIPRAVGQLPAAYHHEPTGRPPRVRGELDPTPIDVAVVGPGNTDDFYSSKYRDLDLGPQFPFGHGLSYATFALGDVECPSEMTVEAALRDGVPVSVTVENTSAITADEVVLLFVRDEVASVARPVRQLAGFDRVTLAPGERRTVSFVVGERELGFPATGAAVSDLVVEPGRFTLTAEGSGGASRAATFRLG